MEDAMSRQGIEQLIDRWMTEPTFRAELRADPVAAARRIGAPLTTEELTALRNVDWSLSDDELQARYSKSGGC
jgi:hypothetical protein